MFSETPSGLVRHRKIKHAMSNLESVKVFAQRNFYTVDGAIKLIRERKIIGYKIGHRWYVVRLMPIGD